MDLYRACIHGKADAVRELLQSGVDPNELMYDGRHPLFVEELLPSVMEVLLEAGADPHATYEDVPAIVHHASEGRLDVGLDFQGPYMYFTEEGTVHSENVKLLLQYGADPNTRDVSGSPAFHSALDSLRPLCAQVLLDGGADPYLRDAQGRNAREAFGDGSSASIIYLLPSVEVDKRHLRRAIAEVHALLARVFGE